MNFSVKNNRLKLSNSYDVSGSINTSSLLVGTSIGINPTNTLDVSGTANITGNLSVDTNTLFVDASNNRVGVGTITPTTTLDVAGAVTATSYNCGQVIVSSNQIYRNSSNEFYVNFTGTGNTIVGNNIGNVSIGAGTNPSYKLDVGGTARVSGDFLVDTNTLFVDSSNNRVGIGTITPTEKLTINSGNLLMNGTFDGMLMNPGVGGGSLAITRGGTFTNNVQQINAPYTDNVGSSSGGGSQIALGKNEMTFSTYPNTGTAGSPITLTERMKLTPTGLGINTATPTYKLHVEGSGTANEIVGWFNNQGNFSSSIAVRQASKTAYLTNHSGSGTPNYDGQLSNAISFGVSSGTSPIQFWNGNTGVGSRGTAKMTILENGNVGIGTSTPAYPLDVSGSAKFTTIRDSANLTGTSGQVLSSTGSALSWITPSVSTLMAVLRESTNFGVASTITFPATANSRVSRNINDIQYNTLGITNVAPNFTIPGSGTFKIVVRANFSALWSNTMNAYGTVHSRVYLRNETDNIDEVLIGETCVGEQQQKTDGTVFACQGLANLTGVFSQTSTKLYSIQQIANTLFRTGITNPTKTGGTPSSTSTANPEYYVNVEITKIA
jgi:hypothetical protein